MKEHKPDTLEPKKRREAPKQAVAAPTEDQQQNHAAQLKKQRKSTKWASTVPVCVFTQDLLKKLHQSRQPDALAVPKILSTPPGLCEMHRTLILEEVQNL